MTRSLLVVQHEASAPAGWFGDRLTHCGLHLDVRHPYAGDGLPPLAPYDGLLVLGGAMDSWDDEATPWLPATRDLVADAERTGTPALGICLGHQLAALALGGEVGRNPHGATVGLRRMGWSPGATHDRLLGPSVGAESVVHWNSDVVTRLPDGAEVLARTADDAVQAARLGESVWGVQCHPEVDAGIVGTWVDDELPRTADEPSRQALRALPAAVAAVDDELQRQWLPFADGFAELVRRSDAGR